MKVIIEAFNTADNWRLRGPVKFRIYADQSFFNSDGQYVAQGTPGNSNTAYLEVDCTAVANVLTIPSIEIDSTVDALDNPWATYTAEIVAQGRRVPFLANFPVNPIAEDDPSTTWGEIILQRNLLAPQSITESLSRQISGMISLAAGQLTKASETNTGVTALTANPLDPSFPVAVSADDPIWQALAISPTAILNVKSFGAVGDGITDDTVSIQAALDYIAASGRDTTLFFPAGIYIIDGPLQDIGLSNAQIVLPKRDSPLSILSIRLLGATPPAYAWGTDSGTIIQSTLTAGNGQMIGVKNDIAGVSVPPAAAVHKNVSWISLVVENITLRMQPDPTNSALDLTHIPHYQLRNLRADTTDIAIQLIGGGTPDFTFTQPTTSTSYAIKGNIELVNVAIYDNIEVLGFYNGIRFGELTNADNITICGCFYPAELSASQHRSDIGRLLVVSCWHGIRVTGAHRIAINAYDVEHNPAIGTLDDISDPGNLLQGRINWFCETAITTGPFTGQIFGIDGAANVHLTRLNRSGSTRSPSTSTTVGTASLEDSGHVVDETYSSEATSDDTKIAWKLLTKIQNGLSNYIGIVAALNKAVVAGGRRVAQIAFRTDGDLNSGALELYTADTGTLNLVAFADKQANFSVVRHLPRGEGPALASASTITPTRGVHVVSGTAAIDNIAVPAIAGGGSVTVAFIPSGAWTYTNAGNILGTGVAVVGRTMFATWSSSLGKWSMSY